MIFAARNLDESACTATGAGDLNLAVRGRNTDSLQSGLGVRLSRRFQSHRGGWWEPEVKLRWQHEFNDTDRFVTSSLVGSARTFQTLGRAVDSDSLQSRVGVSGRTESGVEVNASCFREDPSGFELDGIVGRHRAIVPTGPATQAQKALRELPAGQQHLELTPSEAGQRRALFLAQVDEGLVVRQDCRVERRRFRTAALVFPDEAREPLSGHGAC